MIYLLEAVKKTVGNFWLKLRTTEKQKMGIITTQHSKLAKTQPVGFDRVQKELLMTLVMGGGGGKREGGWFVCSF